MTEMVDHGLTAIPAPALGAISDVPIESHSNNVGLYRQPIFIAPQSPAAPPGPGGAAALPGIVTVDEVTVSPDRVARDGTVKVRARLGASGAEADGVSVFFYDGDPRAGGTLFDVEMIPRIRRDGTYVAQVLFEPRTCGEHRIVVVARPGQGAAATGAATVQVGDCAVTQLSGSATRVGDGTDNAQVKIAGRFALSPPDAAPNLGLARVTLRSLLAETGGAGELVDRVAAGPVLLTARSGGKPGSAVFESHPASARPFFRMEIKLRSAGLLEFSLRVDRAVLSHDPVRCSAARPSTTELVTHVVIEDGQRAPVTVAVARPWECVGRDPRTPTELRLRN
jgi:hypothetical protein